MQKKRVWRCVFVAAALLAAAGGAYRFLTSEANTVRELYIVGDVKGPSVNEMQQVVQRTVQGTLFTVNLKAVKEAVQELSWVQSASVERVWPDGLKVTVIKHNPVAIWEDGRLVSSEGILFTGNDESIEKLADMPMFSGDAAYSVQAVQYLPAFMKAAKALGGRLKGVHASYRGSWSVTVELKTTPVVTIELGRALTENSPVERLERVVKHYPDLCRIMQGCPLRIDARYRDAFAAQLPNAESARLWRLEHPAVQKKGEG